jgi:hypothetical protein
MFYLSEGTKNNIFIQELHLTDNNLGINEIYMKHLRDGL